MTQKMPGGGEAKPGVDQRHLNHSIDNPLEATLALALDGATYANAIQPAGHFGPIRWPEADAERLTLIRAHLASGPATFEYAPMNKPPETVGVDSLTLAAFIPAADGRCPILAVDLDAAAGHGAKGLARPEHAARCIAERGDNAGLADGVLVAKSRGGAGRHVFVFPPEPVSLADGVLTIARLAADGFKVATADAKDTGNPHAFSRPNGSLPKLGESGAVELFPRSTTKPARGWPIVLPIAARLIDVFSDQPSTLDAIPRCNADAWRAYIDEARKAMRRRTPPTRRRTLARRCPPGPVRLHAETEAFLAGRTPQGSRNAAAFASACSLLGGGMSEAEARNLILAGAERCGLPEREALAAFKSATNATQRSVTP